MKRGGALLIALLLAACGKPTAQQGPLPDFTFTNKAIDLPGDAAALPAGPAFALVTQHCTGCHSAEMLTTQPKLDAKTWAAEVAKMRTVYHAPIDPAEDAALVKALGALPGQGASARPR
ncbi:MAG: cytochrome C nitrite reductase [Sphingobium sp.]|jgi:hypothetical protein|nr:cytochrome C nitrite reductase [Sphingobium sp.]